MLTVNGETRSLSEALEVKAGDQVGIDLAAGGHWYGHGFNHDQPYPLETGEVDNAAFAVNNIQSPIWMCSKGHAFVADTRSELTVSLNRGGDGQLQIACGNDFTLRIFSGENLVAAWRKMKADLGWTRPTRRIGISF